MIIRYIILKNKNFKKMSKISQKILMVVGASMLVGGIILVATSFSRFGGFNFDSSSFGSMAFSMFGGILLIGLGLFMLICGAVSMFLFEDTGSSSYKSSTMPSAADNPYRAKKAVKSKNIKNTKRICEFCNAELSSEEKFCSSCGSEIK